MKSQSETSADCDGERGGGCKEIDLLTISSHKLIVLNITKMLVIEVKRVSEC